LHIRADELFGVLLENLVDLVQDRVDVVGQLVLPLLDLIGLPDIGVLLVLGPPRGLPLTAGVFRRHYLTSVLRGAARGPNAILACQTAIQP
jgi:hypothetical protein